MSITKGLGEGYTNLKSSLYCHASGAEQEGGGSILLISSQTQRQLEGSPWKSFPSRWVRGRGEVSAAGARSRNTWSSELTSRGQERPKIGQEHQMLEG